MIAIISSPALRALCLGTLALASACALPQRTTDELPPRLGTVDEHRDAAAERIRQEKENRELATWRAEQKQREEEAEARRRAEAEQVQVTRLADLQRQKEADEARAREEAAGQERAAAEARQKVVRARESVAGQVPDKLARRRADPRWTRPGFSGLLCAARADRDRAAAKLATEKKKGKKADPGRVADAQRRLDAAQARSERARAGLKQLGLEPLGCKDARTSEVASCFQASDAGRSCKKGMGYVEVVRSFDG